MQLEASSLLSAQARQSLPEKESEQKSLLGRDLVFVGDRPKGYQHQCPFKDPIGSSVTPS